MRGGQTGVRYTISYVLANPLTTASKIVRTLREWSWSYVSGAIGFMLGWFQPELSLTSTQTVALVFALGLSTVPSQDDEDTLSVPVRVACLAVFAVAAAGIVASMLIGFTFIDDDTVLGVQGRYFLPVIPCLLLGLKGHVLSVEARMGPAIVLLFGTFSWFFVTQMTFNMLCLT